MMIKVKLYHLKNGVISSKEWNLLTGVKATIIFNNEKTVIKEKVSEDEKADTVSNN